MFSAVFYLTVLVLIEIFLAPLLWRVCYPDGENNFSPAHVLIPSSGLLTKAMLTVPSLHIYTHTQSHTHITVSSVCYNPVASLVVLSGIL